MENMMNITKTDANNFSIDMDSLNNVIGGFLTRDNFPEWAYRDAGFKVVTHVFSRNEYIKDGKSYNHDEANAIMAANGYEVVKKIVTYTSYGYFVRHNGVDKRWY